MNDPFSKLDVSERKLLAVFARYGRNGRAITVESLAAHTAMRMNSRELASALRKLVARGLIRRGGGLLKASEPDTFLGRKHHQSTPLPYEEELPHERHDALTEALEYIKAGGIIRKYSLVWSGRSEVPRIIIWKATDASDQSLRRSITHSLAGLAAESQITIEKD